MLWLVYSCFWIPLHADRVLVAKLEFKLEEHPGQLLRASVELAKMWRQVGLLSWGIFPLVGFGFCAGRRQRV
jgi:hypothetical protein